MKQPTTLEEDARYKELLDEEVDNSVSFYAWSLSKETIRGFSSTRLEAQYKYFEEKLECKYKEIADIKQMVLHESKEFQKTARELKDGYDKLISEKIKEIEELKKEVERLKGGGIPYDDLSSSFKEAIVKIEENMQRKQLPPNQH